jgi:hypothetical protein
MHVFDTMQLVADRTEQSVAVPSNLTNLKPTAFQLRGEVFQVDQVECTFFLRLCLLTLLPLGLPLLFLPMTFAAHLPMAQDRPKCHKMLVARRSF